MRFKHRSRRACCCWASREKPKAFDKNHSLLILLEKNQSLVLGTRLVFRAVMVALFLATKRHKRHKNDQVANLNDVRRRISKYSSWISKLERRSLSSLGYFQTINFLQGRLILSAERGVRIAEYKAETQSCGEVEDGQVGQSADDTDGADWTDGSFSGSPVFGIIGGDC